MHVLESQVWRVICATEGNADEQREAFLLVANYDAPPDPRGVAGRTRSKGWG